MTEALRPSSTVVRRSSGSRSCGGPVRAHPWSVASNVSQAQGGLASVSPPAPPPTPCRRSCPSCPPVPRLWPGGRLSRRRSECVDVKRLARCRLPPVVSPLVVASLVERIGGWSGRREDAETFCGGGGCNALVGGVRCSGVGDGP